MTEGGGPCCLNAKVVKEQMRTLSLSTTYLQSISTSGHITSRQVITILKYGISHKVKQCYFLVALLLILLLLYVVIRLLVIRFSLRNTWFHLEAVHVVFVVDRSIVGVVGYFLRVIQFFSNKTSFC
jgi:hypothetical protein